MPIWRCRKNRISVHFIANIQADAYPKVCTRFMTHLELVADKILQLLEDFLLVHPKEFSVRGIYSCPMMVSPTASHTIRPTLCPTDDEVLLLPRYAAIANSIRKATASGNSNWRLLRLAWGQWVKIDVCNGGGGKAVHSRIWPDIAG